ncbi:MAG: helix-turn-helix domain-containing protein [Phycisphaerae bacterium]|nr:helix-turn-helix domain-containing protein [Phycisphaerae bacterium]NUQ10079.1 helix-turn-helix domain-containing protein [Phycisphaerae bacterium]
MNDPPEKLLTTTEVCELLSIGKRTLWKWLAARSLPPPDARLKGKWLRWRASTIQTWIEEQKCHNNGTHK